MQAKSHRNEHLGAALVLFVILNVTYFPYLWGPLNLLSAAHDMPSITPAGAAQLAPVSQADWKLKDPDGSGAVAEPNFALEHDQLFAEHVLPLWNPYAAFGVPESAAMQQQPFDPLIAPMVLFPNPWTYTWYVLLRLFIAGFATYTFLRFFTNWFGALVGGIAFMLSGYFTLYVSMPHISVEAMLPVLLSTTELFIRKRTRASFIWLAVAAAISVVGGMPEATFLALSLTFVYGVVRSLTAWQLERHRPKTFLLFALAVVFGAGAASFVSFPFVEYERISYNVHDPNVNGGTIAGSVFIDHPEWALGTYLAPLMFGKVWSPTIADFGDGNATDGYWGFGAFFLAVVALCALVRSRLYDATGPAIFFSLTALFFIAKRFGEPLVNWLGYLPGFKYVVFGKYEEPLIAVSVAIVAGLGAGFIRQARRQDVTIVACAALIVLGCTTAVYNATRVLVIGSIADTYFGWSLLGGLLALALLAASASAVLLARTSRMKNVASGSIAAVLTLELVFNYLAPAYYVVDPGPPKSADPYLGASYVRRLRSMTDPESRIYSVRSNFLFNNWAEAFDLLDVRYQDALMPDRYLPLVLAIFKGDPEEGDGSGISGAPDSDAGRRFLRLASVKYVIAPGAVDRRSLLGAIRAKLAEPQSSSSGFASSVDVGEWHDGFMVSPPSSTLSIARSIPKHAPHLRTCIAVPSWMQMTRAPVRFTVSVRTARETHVAFSRLSTSGTCAPVDVDLERFAGRNVTLTFANDGVPNRSTAFWGSPELFSGSVSDATLSLAYHDDGISVYRFTEALPRARIVGRAVLADDAASALLATADVAGPDPGGSAVIDRSEIPSADMPSITHLAAAVPGIPGSARIVAAGSSTVKIDASLRAPGLLVLSDTYFPGWKATVDGGDVPIVRTNYLFRGLPLAAGHHRVVFSYEPLSFAVGVLVSLACAGALGAICVFAFRRAW